MVQIWSFRICTIFLPESQNVVVFCTRDSRSGGVYPRQMSPMNSAGYHVPVAGIYRPIAADRFCVGLRLRQTSGMSACPIPFRKQILLSLNGLFHKVCPKAASGTRRNVSLPDILCAQTAGEQLSLLCQSPCKGQQKICFNESGIRTGGRFRMVCSKIKQTQKYHHLQRLI